MNITTQAISVPQYEFMRFKKPNTFSEILYSGGLGCGKSEALCVACARWLSVPNTTAIMVSTTLLALKRSTIPLLRKYLPERIIAKGTFREGDVTLRNGSRLICSGTRDADRLKSINAHATFFEEVTHTTQDNYNTISLRGRMPHPYGNAAMSVCNPASRRHWCYQHFIRGMNNKTIFALSGKSTDNPYLNQGYINKLNSLSPSRQALLRDGEWGTPENIIFFGFSSTNLCEVPPFVPYKFILLQDYGGGTGTAGLLGAWIDETGDKMFVVDEFAGEKVTHRYMLTKMDQMLRTHGGEQASTQVIYDAANAALGMDMRNAGWATATCNKGIEEGIAVVNDQFVANNLFIHPRCKLLLDAVETTMRDDLGNIRKKKGWDLLDPLRYGVVHQHGNGNIRVSFS